MFEHPTGLILRRIDVSNRDHQREPSTLLRREGLGGGGGSISEEVDEENVIMSHQQHAAD